MTEIDWLSLAKDYGEAALSVVGTVLVFLVSTVSGVAAWAFKRHKARMAKHYNLITELGKAFVGFKEGSAQDHAKIKEAVMGQRAEIHLLKQTIDPLKAGMLNLEGAIRNQNDTLNRYVEKMGVVQGKLDAVFSVFDAQAARATDVLKRGTKP